MLHRYSRDPDPIRAAAGDLMAHLLALKEEPAVQGGEPAARHKRAHAALGLVLEWLMDPRMVAWCPEIRDRELYAPLFDLARALQAQSDGRKPSLLDAKQGGRRVSADEATYKARCAALVELLARADDSSPAEAAEKAAAILARKGARIPLRGYVDRITPETLLQWRKDAHRPKQHKELAEAYDRTVLKVTTRAVSREQLRQMAEALIDPPPP
jgi:hypothetical protein